MTQRYFIFKLNPGEEGYEPRKELYKITINAKYDTSNPAEHIIEYSNRTGIHNVVEEIVPALVRRLIEEDPRIREQLREWAERVAERAER